ncbi:MAG TPA: hypothetical protein VNW06_00660 [Cytophagaceae bacterium]|nr:hypothetical protein [Cytophagaceae bacterium]
MTKYFMNFESFTSATDTSPTLTFNIPTENNNSFLINGIESFENEYGFRTLIVSYNKERALQIIKNSTDEYLVTGDKLSTKKKAQEFKQYLSKNIDMKKSMRENDMMNLWHSVSANDFYFCL